LLSVIRGSHHAISMQAAARRWECHGQRVLRETIDGCNCTRMQSVTLEACSKRTHRVLIDRLGPAKHIAQRRKVHTRKLVVAELPCAAVIGEVRRGRERAAIAIDQVQPACRTRKKHEWRRDHDRQRIVERCKPRADQSHIVIERQPADHHIVRRHADAITHRANIGEQVGVSQRDAFRVSCAARCVLKQSHVRRMRWFDAIERHVANLLGQENMAKLRHTQRKQLRNRGHFVEGNQRLRLRVVQNGRIARNVFLQRLQLRGWVERNRDCVAQQNPEKTDEVFAGRRQHERHRVTAFDTCCPQASRYFQSFATQFAVRDARFVERLVDQYQMRARAVLRRVPLQGFA